MKSSRHSKLSPKEGKQFAAKLLFQYRVMVEGDPGRRRLCEQRIIVFYHRNINGALAEAKRRGKDAQYDYKNSDGNTVYFEFVGVVHLLELGIECNSDEVWYDIFYKMRPMERRKLLLPANLNR